ncbi:Prestin [Blattella germanica]|nr:Prestin [Blattella germanica]
MAEPESELSKVRFSLTDEVKVFESDDKNCRDKCKHCMLNCEGKCFIHLRDSLPVLKWIREYRWKKDILYDMAAGMTVAVMHIPHGMAYSTLANVSPIHGIYMAFFPVIVYFIFATSRHVSVGTFAVICLMTGEVVHENTNSTKNGTSEYTPIEVGTAVCLTVGLWHLLMFCLRLGIVCSILSGTFVSSFTTGAAFHVFTSQIKELLGISLKPHYGLLTLFYQYEDIILNIPKTNPYTLGLSSSTFLVLLLANYLLVPFVQKKIKVRLPSELIVILIANGLSMGLYLEQYGIRIIGVIPSGFPKVIPPTFSLVIKVAQASFFITVVSYSIHMSMATMFAIKLNYDISGNQEFLAYGLANLVGSFFQCLPISSSLSRSMIQQVTGGRSQIASLVSCLLLLIVLLWVGPFFEPLPRCVLAVVVVSTLIRMLLQVTEVRSIWKLSKLEALVWMGTFLSVIILDVKFGLLIGIALTLIHVFIQSMYPDVRLLGVFRIKTNETEEIIFLSIDDEHAEEIMGTKIVHVSEAFTFFTMNHIKKEIFSCSGVDPQKLLKMRQQMERKKYPDTEIVEEEEKAQMVTFKVENKLGVNHGISIRRDRLKHIIIDMKSVKHLDASGINALETVVKYYKNIDVDVQIISRNERLSNVESIERALLNIKSSNSTE